MHALANILLSIAAAVAYGIAHDQVTARICVEYFTIGHPRVIDSTSPTALAFAWGVLATWWVGLIGGVALAAAARAGTRPKGGAGRMVRPLAYLLVVMALSSAAAGLCGYLLASSGAVNLVEPLASAVPSDRHVPFLVDLWAHSAAYLVGFVGILVLSVRIWRKRRLLTVI
jgi:hypothetical protein